MWTLMIGIVRLGLFLPRAQLISSYAQIEARTSEVDAPPYLLLNSSGSSVHENEIDAFPRHAYPVEQRIVLSKIYQPNQRDVVETPDSSLRKRYYEVGSIACFKLNTEGRNGNINLLHKYRNSTCDFAGEAGKFWVLCSRWLFDRGFWYRRGDVLTKDKCAEGFYCLDTSTSFNGEGEYGDWGDVICVEDNHKLGPKRHKLNQIKPGRSADPSTFIFNMEPPTCSYRPPRKNQPKGSRTRTIMVQAEISLLATGKPYKVDTIYINDLSNPQKPTKLNEKRNAFETDFKITLDTDKLCLKHYEFVVHIAAGYIPWLVIHTNILDATGMRRRGRIGMVSQNITDSMTALEIE